jgi:hypothetical protein
VHRTRAIEGILEWIIDPLRLLVLLVVQLIIRFRAPLPVSGITVASRRRRKVTAGFSHEGAQAQRSVKVNQAQALRQLPRMSRLERLLALLDGASLSLHAPLTALT